MDVNGCKWMFIPLNDGVDFDPSPFVKPIDKFATVSRCWPHIASRSCISISFGDFTNQAGTYLSILSNSESAESEIIWTSPVNTKSQYVTICYNMLQYVTICYNMLQYVTRLLMKRNPGVQLRSRWGLMTPKTTSCVSWDSFANSGWKMLQCESMWHNTWIFDIAKQLRCCWSYNWSEEAPKSQLWTARQRPPILASPLAFESRASVETAPKWSQHVTT